MKKILIVDDDANIREILGDFFSQDLGLSNIEYAQDGLDAYLKCSANKFDLICLDHMMPYLSGLNFCVALREKAGLNQYTPIIMVSAFNLEIQDEVEGLDNISILPKPVDFTKLASCVNKLLGTL